MHRLLHDMNDLKPKKSDEALSEEKRSIGEVEDTLWRRQSRIAAAGMRWRGGVRVVAVPLLQPKGSLVACAATNCRTRSASASRQLPCAIDEAETSSRWQSWRSAMVKASQARPRSERGS